MLTVCYSAKGGQGCTTVAAALALARRGSRLIDTTGDAAAVLGFGEAPDRGCDLLAADQPVEIAAIERLAAHTGPVLLVAAGSITVAAVPEQECPHRSVRVPGCRAPFPSANPDRARWREHDEYRTVSRSASIGRFVTATTAARHPSSTIQPRV